MNPAVIPNGVASGSANGFAARPRAASRATARAGDAWAGSFQPDSEYAPERTSETIRSGTTTAPDSRRKACADAGDASITTAFKGAIVRATAALGLASDRVAPNAALVGAITTYRPSGAACAPAIAVAVPTPATARQARRTRPWVRIVFPSVGRRRSRAFEIGRAHV